MAARKKREAPKAHETTTQTLFVRRVLQELEWRFITPHALSKKVGGPPYKTLDDVLFSGAVPRLTLIHQTALALEMQPHQLLRESDQPFRNREKVVRLRTEPAIFGAPAVAKTATNKRARRK